MASNLQAEGAEACHRPYYTCLTGRYFTRRTVSLCEGPAERRICDAGWSCRTATSGRGWGGTRELNCRGRGAAEEDAVTGDSG